MHVLVLDDEPQVQKILSAFLLRYAQQHGKRMKISEFSKPEQALFELTTHGEDYDMILMDVRMPRVTGCDIYHALQETQPTLLSRLLFITGYPDDLTDMQACILSKPFKYSDLEQNLQRIEETCKAAIAA